MPRGVFLRSTSAAVFQLCRSLSDGTQRKGPGDWVKDNGTRGLGDGPTPAHVELDESRNAVKAIFFKLEQFPRAALSHRQRQAHILYQSEPVKTKTDIKQVANVVFSYHKSAWIYMTAAILNQCL